MDSSKTLHVFGEKYALKRKSGLEKHHVYGECSPENKEIVVSSKISGDLYYVTVLHEMFHGVEHECSIIQAVPAEILEIINDLYAKAVVKNFHLRHRRKKEATK